MPCNTGKFDDTDVILSVQSTLVKEDYLTRTYKRVTHYVCGHCKRERWQHRHVVAQKRPFED